MNPSCEKNLALQKYKKNPVRFCRIVNSFKSISGVNYVQVYYCICKRNKFL